MAKEVTRSGHKCARCKVCGFDVYLVVDKFGYHKGVGKYSGKKCPGSGLKPKSAKNKVRVPRMDEQQEGRFFMDGDYVAGRDGQTLSLGGSGLRWQTIRTIPEPTPDYDGGFFDGPDPLSVEVPTYTATAVQALNLDAEQRQAQGDIEYLQRALEAGGWAGDTAPAIPAVTSAPVGAVVPVDDGMRQNLEAVLAAEPPDSPVVTAFRRMTQEQTDELLVRIQQSARLTLAQLTAEFDEMYASNANADEEPPPGGDEER